MNIVEKKIAAEAARLLIAGGYFITVDFERGYEPSSAVDSQSITKIIECADEVDECWFMVTRKAGDRPYDGFLYFVWGNGENGWTCMSDWSGGEIATILAPLTEITRETDEEALFEPPMLALEGIVRELIYGDGTDACLQRTIDLCNAAKDRFGIERVKVGA